MSRYQRDGRAPLPNSENTSRVMSANRGKDTGPEMLLRRALWVKGVRGYRVHPKNLPGRPDIVFTRHRLAIFMNGCFWHRCPKCNPSVPKTHTDFWQHKFERNIKRDHEKVKVLEGDGWTVLVVWECELKSNPESVVNIIMSALDEHDRTRA